jgi:hypothetical protein
VTGTEYVERGSAIQLICNASGRPEPPYNVDWYKVSKRLVNNIIFSLTPSTL